MKKNTDFLKIPMNRIIALVLMDIMAVVVASFASIYLRFEFSFKEIPAHYLERYENILPFTIAITEYVLDYPVLFRCMETI